MPQISEHQITWIKDKTSKSDKSKIIVRYFNTPFSIIARISRQKISKIKFEPHYQPT